MLNMHQKWTPPWELTKLPRLPSRLRMGTPPPRLPRHLRPLDLGAFRSLLLSPLTPSPQYNGYATTRYAHPVQKILATPLQYYRLLYCKFSGLGIPHFSFHFHIPPLPFPILSSLNLTRPCDQFLDQELIPYRYSSCSSSVLLVVFLLG